jgi:ABC-type sulfate/molybdate transport systems ATPase subunit
MSSVRGLYRDYGDFKVNIPSWEIPDKGISALIGPSGAGKTSVFRLLIGLEPCPTLEWKFGDEDIAKLPVPKRKLGVVFQTLELFSHLTAMENLQFAQRARGLALEHEFRDELINVLKIGHCIHQKTATLSGGEKQRVALARALAGKPRFLFLDEPFSAIDEEMRSEARQLVLKCVERFSIPTLIITHDMRDVEALKAVPFKLFAGSLTT